MAERALVVGGTGPTGPFVVNGLVSRGYEVTMVHTGRHEREEIPPSVAHIHTDPSDAAVTADALGPDTFDLAVVMYGRLRTLAPMLVDRVGRLVTIGGVGALAGWVDPGDLFPTGMTVPSDPANPRASTDEPVGKIRRIVSTEDTVFEHHPTAIHLRYPMLYGPRQLIPREWPMVRRALDKRRPLIVADGGLTLKSVAYVENAAHAVLCAVDRAAEGAGRVFNVTDERALTIRQTAEVVADALDHRFDFVSLPNRLAGPARPVLMHHSTSHRLVDSGPLRSVLGYRDVVGPEEGVRRTARWLAANPPSERSQALLQDPFDYRAEDELVERWQATMDTFEQPQYAAEPGYGAAYYGRVPNPATGSSRVEPPE